MHGVEVDAFALRAPFGGDGFGKAFGRDGERLAAGGAQRARVEQNAPEAVVESDGDVGVEALRPLIDLAFYALGVFRALFGH